MGKIDLFKALYKDREGTGFLSRALKNRRDLKTISQRKRTLQFEIPKEAYVYRILKNGRNQPLREKPFIIDDLTLNRAPKICDCNGNRLFGENSVICEYRNYIDGLWIDICVIYEHNDWYYRRWYKVIGNLSENID
jgi:hypothetical protein